MNTYKFVKKYFPNWKIGSATHVNGKYGAVILQDKETKIVIFFNLNGDHYWQDEHCTVERVEAY